MNYFIDTEFDESGPLVPVRLLSIGIVAEDGREYYAVADSDHSLVNEWVAGNVLPHLGDSPRKSLSVMAREIREFCGDDPIFYGYYADYDWVVFCQIFGAMVNLPNGWPMYCRDLRQTADELRVRLPKQSSTEHNALNDARWNLEAWKAIRDYR